MPLCKNVKKGEKCYYTGKENTPRGRGYSAKYEKEGKKMKGRDGEMYVVKGERWVKVVSRKGNPKGLHQTEDRVDFDEGLLYVIVAQQLGDDEEIKFYQNRESFEQHHAGYNQATEPVRFKRGEAIIVITDNERQGSWEENPDYWPQDNEYFNVYNSVDDALKALNSHGENTDTLGIDVYDFDSAVREYGN